MKKIRKAVRWIRILLALTAIYFGVVTYLAYKYVHPARKAYVLPVGFEVVHLDAQKGEGAPVYLWVKRPKGPVKGSFVLVHGYGGTPTDWVKLSNLLAGQGFLCVVPHMPAHADSPDDKVTFGARESDVVIASAEWAREAAPDKPLMAHGMSLGGASVWLASQKRPELFSAIGSEGAFADFTEGTRAYLGPASNILGPIIPIGSTFAGVNPSDLVPEKAAAKWRGKPALVIHGDADKLFPVSFGDRIAKAVGVKLWLVPGAEHAKVMREHISELSTRLTATLAARSSRTTQRP